MPVRTMCARTRYQEGWCECARASFSKTQGEPYAFKTLTNESIFAGNVMHEASVLEWVW